MHPALQAIDLRSHTGQLVMHLECTVHAARLRQEGRQLLSCRFEQAASPSSPSTANPGIERFLPICPPFRGSIAAACWTNASRGPSLTVPIVRRLAKPAPPRLHPDVGLQPALRAQDPFSQRAAQLRRIDAGQRGRRSRSRSTRAAHLARPSPPARPACARLRGCRCCRSCRAARSSRSRRAS